MIFQQSIIPKKTCPAHYANLLLCYRPVAADVRKPEQVEAAVAKTVETYGRIDFLINGAAGNFLAPFEGLSYNAFRTVIEIDTLGTFNFTKAALPHLKASKGAVLNISATLHYTGKAFQLHVGAAKAAIDALTTHWAVELGPHGIRKYSFLALIMYVHVFVSSSSCYIV